MTKQKIEIKCCPLCKSQQYKIAGNIDINHLIGLWLEKWEFNPIWDCYTNEKLERRKCVGCGLYWYNYHLPDSEEMYKRMEDTGRYYPQYRTTYGVMREMLLKLKPQTLLEIGSGNGAFIKHIDGIVPSIIGSEYNKDIAKKCRDMGMNITMKNIDEINETFDIVCHHEVFEHVRDTHTFFKQNIRLMKCGGKLIIGCPDPESLLVIVGNGECHHPPHHQYAFSRQTFNWLANRYELKITDYQKTEISERQYQKYLAKTGESISIEKLRKKYTGHSHVVVFEKL